MPESKTFKEWIEKTKEFYSNDKLNQANFMNLLDSLPDPLRKHIQSCKKCQEEIKVFIHNMSVETWKMTNSTILHSGLLDE